MITPQHPIGFGLMGVPPNSKAQNPSFFVNKYPNMTNGCKTTWNFFGDGHGKGPHDGVGVVIKRLIQNEQLDANGGKLQNASSIICSRF